jgi:hypothetical protein
MADNLGHDRKLLSYVFSKAIDNRHLSGQSRYRNQLLIRYATRIAVVWPINSSHWLVGGRPTHPPLQRAAKRSAHSQRVPRL